MAVTRTIKVSSITLGAITYSSTAGGVIDLRETIETGEILTDHSDQNAPSFFAFPRQIRRLRFSLADCGAQTLPVIGTGYAVTAVISDGQPSATTKTLTFGTLYCKNPGAGTWTHDNVNEQEVELVGAYSTRTIA